MKGFVVNVMDLAMLHIFFKDAILQPLFDSINELTLQQVSNIYGYHYVILGIQCLVNCYIMLLFT